MPILEYVCKECMHQFETLVQGSRIPECSADLAARAPVGPCGAGGDPRGPGACAMN